MTPQFVLFARPNALPHSRLGVTATRRLGKAVWRNRARRLVREAYRQHREDLPASYDFVVVARAPLLQMKSTELGPILVQAARQAVSEPRPC